MNEDQMRHYQSKLAFETDSWDLYSALDKNENWVAVDGRKAEAYDMEHIPGALNLPHREITPESVKDLDKTKTYICYCDGIGCNASTKTSVKLMSLGFEVKELLGGLDWWKRDGYATEGQNAQSGTDIICGC